MFEVISHDLTTASSLAQDFVSYINLVARGLVVSQCPSAPSASAATIDTPDVAQQQQMQSLLRSLTAAEAERDVAVKLLKMAEEARSIEVSSLLASHALALDSSETTFAEERRRADNVIASLRRQLSEAQSEAASVVSVMDDARATRLAEDCLSIVAREHQAALTALACQAVAASAARDDAQRRTAVAEARVQVLEALMCPDDSANMEREAAGGAGEKEGYLCHQRQEDQVCEA